ncbi:MAG: aminotransferase class V-fold PLP-dependent enzyme [candidate division KSB1 bacterium]|nr:aminotransferase class V-fold PLP-dependent enzyme [candidate division KSB1 bacterium]
MNHLIYLDNSSTTFPKPEEVHEFMGQFYRTHGVNPGRSGYSLAVEAEAMVNETRKRLTEFFNGEAPDHLVFTYNATDSLNMIINGILKLDDHIITTTLEHNSVLRPIYHLVMAGMVKADYIPFDEAGYIHPEEVLKKIKRNTKLVVVNHGSNVIGTVQPIKELGALCREKGIVFAIDASQTAGVVPIDVKEMNIDVVAFTGHKSLLGPTGIGGLYVRPGITITPTRVGGTGIRSADRWHPEEYPYRLEAGTINVLGVAGLLAAQKWLAKVGLANIHQREMELWKRLRDGLETIDGVTLYCADSVTNHIPVLSCNISGYKPGDTGKILSEDYHIATRTGLHCAPLVHQQLETDKIKGTVRFSIGPFNTTDHIDAAVEAIREIAKKRRS